MSDKIKIFYNKAHNDDASIPVWVVQAKGSTHYVNHVTIAPGIGFCTKEASEHPSTKGSLLVKGTLTIKDGEANIEP